MSATRVAYRSLLRNIRSVFSADTHAVATLSAQAQVAFRMHADEKDPTEIGEHRDYSTRTLMARFSTRIDAADTSCFVQVNVLRKQLKRLTFWGSTLCRRGSTSLGDMVRIARTCVVPGTGSSSTVDGTPDLALLP